MNYLSVHKLKKRFGEKELFHDVNFGIDQGQKAGLVAANGSGKSTLLRILLGKESHDDGDVVFRNGVKVGFLQQDDDLNPEHTILQEVLHGQSPALNTLRKYKLLMETDPAGPAMEEVMNRMHELSAWDYEARISEVLGKLGIHQLSHQVGKCSGGERKRIQLARVILEEPDFLVLDEPTNHLDLDMMEGYLTQANLTLLMVTHDRYFLEAVCDSIIELEDGKVYLHDGNFSRYLEHKAQREEELTATVEKARNLYRRELEWVRRMPKARGTKQKARLKSFEGTKETAFTNLNKQEIRPQVNIERLGSKIVELHNVSKSFGAKQLIEAYTYHFKKGEKAGLVGPNGSGKSTFLRLICGEIEPDKGKVVVGDTVKFGWYRQDGLPESMAEKKVIDVVREVAEYIPLKKGQQLTAAQLLERFLFPRSVHYRYAHTLSGGERKRLYLLTILMTNPNFLILDEPTNDLDIATMTVLEDFLLDFEGCVLVVSHDRYFLDKICEHLFAFRGAGIIKDFPGNYTQYRLWVKEQDKALTQDKPALAKEKQTKTSSTAEKKKLTYKEKLEFEQLDKEIPELEERRDTMNAQVANGEVKPEDAEGFYKELMALGEEIELKTLRWMELADLV